MNSTYNFTSAKEQLERIARERSSEKLAGTQLSDLGWDELTRMARVVNDNAGYTKRLAAREDKFDQDEENQEDVEIVWHVQGVLTSLELPPFVPKGKYQEKAKFLRQGVRLSGLGSPTFEKAAQGIGDVVALYSRTVSMVQPASFMGSDEWGTYLDVSNRYFSSTRERRGGANVPFDCDIDPSGALAAIEGAKYYHGEENSVLYLERKYNQLEGKRHTSRIAPVTFKAGDIAEVQFTLTLALVKNQEWKLIPTLRCLTLLEGKYSRDCIRIGFQPINSRNGSSNYMRPANKPLKRRAGFDRDENDEELPCEKFARMDLDNPHK